MTTLHRLRVFITVAKHLSVSRAALELNVVPSAISHEVGSLEQDLKIKLVTPTGRGIRLTRDGETINKTLPSLLDQIDGLLNQHRTKNHSEITGSLIIGGSHGPSARLLPELITSFRQAFPDVEIAHRTGTSTEVQQKVLDGMVEFALVSNPVPQVTLAVERYAEERLLFVATPSHDAGKFGKITPAQLAAAKILIGDTKDGEDQAIKFLRRRLPAGLKLKIGARFDDAGALKSSVKSGGGIGVLYHDMVADELHNGSLKEITVTGVNLDGYVHLIYLKANPLSDTAAKFIEHMRAQHEPLPQPVLAKRPRRTSPAKRRMLSANRNL